MIAAAKTGRERRSKIVVIKIDHTNKGMWYMVIDCIFMLIIVVIKLIAPKMEETPARWSEKIVKSTDGPICEIWFERGG